MAKKEKRKPGQPTKYDDQFIDDLIEYFSKPPYKTEKKQIVTKKGDVVDITVDVPSDMPTLAGFAIKIGVSRDTLLEWATAKNEDGSLKHPEFSGAYNRAKDYQENYLAVNGNKGLINAAFGIFTAKNIIKWRDKQPDEVDTIVNNNNTTVTSASDKDLEETIKKLLGVKK
jgi:hypothetical protein